MSDEDGGSQRSIGTKHLDGVSLRIGRAAKAITGTMKLWLDDLRSPPPGEDWIWARTVEEAQEPLAGGKITHASLDYDLGEDRDGKVLPNGGALVKWMAAENAWPTESIDIHSRSRVGIAALRDQIRRSGIFSRDSSTRRFTRSDGAR